MMADTEAPPAGKRENVLTRKIGPLPTWGWVSIVGGTVIVWAVYEHNKAGSTAAAANSASTTPPDVFMVSGNGNQTTPPEQDGGSGSSKVPWNQNANNIAADARDALIKSGVKNPTAKQIAEERQDILQSARQPGADKKKPKVPAHHRRTPHAHARHK